MRSSEKLAAMASLVQKLDYPDRHRAWSELVVAVERAKGLLLVPSELVAAKGDQFTLEVAIADDPVFSVHAVVERVRRSSLRFSRALIVKLHADARQDLGVRLGTPDVDAALSFGRHAPRFDLRWPVTFRTPALLDTVTTRDLSAEGMHVEMPDRVEPGDVVEFSLHTPQGHALALAGEVQWTSEVTDNVGIRFLYKEEDDRELMRALQLRAVGAQLSVLGKAAIVVLGDEARATQALSVLRAVTRLPLEITPHRADALRMVRADRPRAFFIPADEPELVALCRSISDDAELLGVQLVLYGDEAGRLRQNAREAGIYHALLTPVGAEAASELVQALDLVED
jgi:hypothetical protein